MTKKNLIKSYKRRSSRKDMLFKPDHSEQPQLGVFIEARDAFARASKPNDGQLLLKVSVHSPLNKKASG